MSQSVTESEVGQESATSYGTGAPESEYLEESVTESGVGKPSNDQKSNPWYRRRRTWAICITINIILLIILLPLLFLVIFPAVAQSTISKSIITFNSLSMRLPMNETHFGLDTNGTITNGGSFSATVSFPNGAQMVYNDTVVGELTLPTVSLSGGNGDVSSSTIVHIVNSDSFADFVKAQMNDQNLTFTLKASVTVKSLGITKSGLDLNKDITINGTNGFRDPGAVSITGFQVNQDDTSALTTVVTVSLKNPSPISVFLGTLGVHNIYENVTLGPSIAQNLTLMSGLNTITLNGTVTPKSPDEEPSVNDFLDKLTSGNPVDLISIGDFAKPDGNNEISWLSTGVKALSLSATLQMNKTDLVQGVELGNMTLKFTNASAYAPEMSTSGSNVAYKLPFNISFVVESVAQNLTVLYQNTPLAIYNATWTNATNNATDITLSMPEGPMTVLDGQDSLFQSFLHDITLSDVVSFQIAGVSGVMGKTAIGPVEMDGVNFTVPVQMKGLGGLKTPTNITKFNVGGGTKDALTVLIEAVLLNPSDGTLSMGDVNMAIKFQDVQVGNMLLPNFTITPGLNTINASGSFRPNDTPQGRLVFSTFMNRTSSVLTMGGFPGCSDIESLVPALEALNASAILPGLNQDLVANAALKVHNDTAQTKIVGTTMVFNNIFATSISVFNLQANITSDGLPVGNINLDISSQPLLIPPSTNFTFPELPVLLNLDPVVMFSLLRNAAVAQNMDVRPLDALLKLGNITVDGADPNANPDPSIFANFNLKNFVIQALHQMPLNVQMTAVVSLGEYQTILNYAQNVTATTDDSIALLIPILGAPIVQNLVSKTTTHFDKIFLHDLSDTSFKGDISGLISNTGPFSAIISFPNSVKVSAGGTLLGTMNMADVTSNENVAQINTTSEFLIADADALEQFTIQLLGTDSASWDISADGVVVQALGVAFNNITFSQTVQLQGSNGFQGQVHVLNVQMPGVAPEGGIAMDLTIALFNPGTVGLDPGSIQFNSFFKNVLVGPASSNNAILPDANNTMTLNGRITPKTDPNEIAVISELFSSFITGQDVVIDTVGAGVVPASGSCKWLSQAITHLTMKVVLPAPKGLQLIKNVTIGNLNMTFTSETAYAPLTSSTDVEAVLSNPFGFPMLPQNVAQNFTIINNNVPMVQVNIPQAPVTISPITGAIISKFSNIPFTVISGQEDNFNGFVEELTISKDTTFTLQGSINAITQTPSGAFNIQGIQYNIQTTVPGLQGLQSAPITLSNVTVKGGTSDFLDIGVIVGITNPSTIEVSAGDVVLDIFVGQSLLGQTILNNLVLASGTNNIPAQFRYQPSADVLIGAGADLLGAFLEKKSTGLTIIGNPKSTNIASLAPTFSKLVLSTSLDGIDGQILKAVNVTASATDPTHALMTIIIHNPLDADFAPVNFVSTAFLAGTQQQIGVSNITLPFKLVVPAKGDVTAPNIPLTITMDIQKLEKIIIADGGKVPVDIHLTTTVNVGQFKAAINYVQSNITTIVTL